MKNSTTLTPFRVIPQSPWPISLSLGIWATSLTLFAGHTTVAYYFALSTVFVAVLWGSDVTSESFFQGHRTASVSNGLMMGFFLLLVSEAMLFFGLFWAYLWFALNPSRALGNVWPPAGLSAPSPFHLPALNTAILLLSAASVTWARRGVRAGKSEPAQQGLLVTVLLGILFPLCQWYEYSVSPLTISDSVFGSIFYLITGFRGARVIMGTVLLAWCLHSYYVVKASADKSLQLNAAVYYWRFVDLVWLGVFILLYCW